MRDVNLNGFKKKSRKIFFPFQPQNLRFVAQIRRYDEKIND